MNTLINKDIYNLKPGDLIEVPGIVFDGKPDVVEFWRYTSSSETGFLWARRYKSSDHLTSYTLLEVLNTPAAEVLFSSN